MVQDQSNLDIRVDPLLPQLPADFPVALTFYHHRCWSPRQMRHVHDCLEIGLCLQGSGIFTAGDKIMPFATGDVLVVNTQEFHGLRNAPGEESDWNFLLVHVPGLLAVTGESDALLRTEALAGPGFANIIGPGRTQVHWQVRQLIAEMSAPGGHHESLVRAQLWALLLELHRLLESTDRAGATPAQLLRLEPALHYLTEHYSEDVRVPTLARHCHMSEATLRRLFQAALGCSPQERLAQLRVQMACSLLRSGTRTVLDIVQAVGYDAPSSFNRQFRRVMGASAAAWRRAQRAV